MTSRENNAEQSRVSGAIMPVENSHEGNLQPRQPRDLQGLLRFAVQAGAAGRENPPANLRQLDPERRQFLEEALSSMTVNVAKELSESLETLSSMKESLDAPDGLEDASHYVNALETIMEYVDNIDIANDFCKMNGFTIMNDCISCGIAEVRWRAAEVLAICTQNNSFAQQFAFNLGLLSKLMEIAESDTNDECKIKAFYAVSCMVRDSAQGLSQFTAQDGFSFLLRVMQSGTLKLQIKASFLLSTLSSQNPQIKDSLCKMGFVEQLVGLVQSEHSQAHEHIISGLLSLVTDHEPAVIECRRPELQLQPSLVKLIEDYGDEDAYREEMSYIRQILQIVFSNVTEEER